MKFKFDAEFDRNQIITLYIKANITTKWTNQNSYDPELMLGEGKGLLQKVAPVFCNQLQSIEKAKPRQKQITEILKAKDGVGVGDVRR